jgi:glycosyltransferase involved in cell wall biosynthesis
MNKPIFIEWVGSDIRDSDFLSAINPYYKHAFDNGYECRSMEDGKHKKMTEENFHDIGAMPTLCPEMSMYLNKTLFTSYIPLMQRINVKAFSPQFPSSENSKPLIVHSPSAKMTKGSNYIISAMQELKKDFDFEFVLLHDMKREDVLKIMHKADIFLDQIVIGGYGMAAMEAMSFGKPVMCCLLPQVFEAGLPQDCPIVNTNPDNLKNQLIQLIANPNLRKSIGVESRAYVEKYHDAEKISDQLLKIYTQA